MCTLYLLAVVFYFGKINDFCVSIWVRSLTRWCVEGILIVARWCTNLTEIIDQKTKLDWNLISLQLCLCTFGVWKSCKLCFNVQFWLCRSPYPLHLPLETWIEKGVHIVVNKKYLHDYSCAYYCILILGCFLSTQNKWLMHISCYDY